MTHQESWRKPLPDAPGVYFFLGKKKRVLYVGKATSLRSRVSSYFGKDLVDTRGPLLVKMVEEARSVDYRTTDSVLEALILETDFIKKFNPPYNTEGKDDKSFNCVVVTEEEFPQVLIVRKKDIDFSLLKATCPPKPLRRRLESYKLKAIYGTFPHGPQLQEAMKIIRKIFPYRDSKCRPGQRHPCFNRQIGLCPGVCTGGISQGEYRKTIRHLDLFFKGKKARLLTALQHDMETYAKSEQFEKAQAVKKTIFALQHIQDVALLHRDSKVSVAGEAFRIEAYDIAHLSGTNMVGVMVVVQNGQLKKSDYRTFKIKGFSRSNDTGALREILERRLKHPEWPPPDMIVFDGAIAHYHVVQEVLAQINGLPRIHVVGVVKNEHHRAARLICDALAIKDHERDILLANSEAHRFAIRYHRLLRSRLMS